MPPTPPRPFRPPLPSLLPLVSLLLLIPTTLAGDLVVHLSLSPTNCLFGCKDALDTTLFADTDPTAAYYAALCGSAIFRTSLASCVQAYCTPEEQVAGWDKLIEYCELYGDTKVDGLDQVVATIKGPVEQYDALENVGEVVNGTVLVTRDNWERGTRTENAWERQMNFVGLLVNMALHAAWLRLPIGSMPHRCFWPWCADAADGAAPRLRMEHVHPIRHRRPRFHL